MLSVVASCLLAWFSWRNNDRADDAGNCLSMSAGGIDGWIDGWYSHPTCVLAVPWLINRLESKEGTLTGERPQTLMPDNKVLQSQRQFLERIFLLLSYLMLPDAIPSIRPGYPIFLFFFFAFRLLLVPLDATTLNKHIKLLRLSLAARPTSLEQCSDLSTDPNVDRILPWA